MGSTKRHAARFCPTTRRVILPTSKSQRVRSADLPAADHRCGGGASGRSPARSLKVLLAQLQSTGDVETSARRVAAIVRRDRGADLAVFPELFLPGYVRGCRSAGACDLASPAVKAVQRVAGEQRTAVIVGMTERQPSGSLANAALCVDRDGSVAGLHRKTYVFGAKEREAFSPGECWSIVTLAGWRLGVMICFEMEFPEPARALACSGAELLVTIAANMHPYGADHELASRARALDNRRPHVYVNRVGEEQGLRFVGGSRVIGADGGVLAQLESGERTLVYELRAAESSDSETDYLKVVGPQLPVKSYGPALRCLRA
jgi:predicted amidohydrolase